MCCFCLVFQSYSPQQRVVSVLQSPAENIVCYFCLVFQSYNPHQRVVSVLQSPAENIVCYFCLVFQFYNPHQRVVSVLQSPAESVCVVTVWCFSLTIPSRECMCCYCLVFLSYNPQQRVYVLFLFGVSVLQPPAESVWVVTVWCFSLTIPSRECMCPGLTASCWLMKWTRHVHLSPYRYCPQQN